MSKDSGALSNEILDELKAFVQRDVMRLGSTEAVLQEGKPKFHWPPHPVSYDFHISPNRFSERATLDVDGETFPVKVATTEHGVFGRCEDLWIEAKGETLAKMLVEMKKSLQPLFDRQKAMAIALGREGRFTGHMRDLRPHDLVKLLYVEDRGLAAEAHTEIETHSTPRIFTPALVWILGDTQHPHRRSAQWCVLDSFEDLPRFVESDAQEKEAIKAIYQLIWSADDDYCRTAFKAGVVLGGHLPGGEGGRLLITALGSPSRIARRSAIHGLFHVVEWNPNLRSEVVKALRDAAAKETDPDLRTFSETMSKDIESDSMDHHPEPVFAGEHN